MAGDWLKMELCLPHKPEVLAMSAKTGMEPDLIVGKCFRLWSWFDQHTKEGNAAGVTLVTLSYAIGNGDANIAFLDALKSVGWIVEDEQGISLPNFDRHNGETAKTRALTAKRVAKHKSKSNAESNGHSVTVSVNSSLPREEKRREEEINTLVVSKLTPCPHQEILSLFSEELPELPQPRIWEGKREKDLSARWKWVMGQAEKDGKESTKEYGLDFFRRMFAYIAKSDFLMGRNSPWSCDLGWIVNATNFAKILDGNYENKVAA